MRHALALTLGATLAVGAASLGAQERPPAPEPVTAADSLALAARTVMLAGVVRDSAGRPLGGAEVRAGALHFTVSDADGRFAMLGVPPDTVQLLVRRIGYLPADVILAADAGARVELAVRLVSSAQELGTIVIEGQRMDTRLWKSGFYERQRQGFGRSFGPEDLEKSSTPLSGFLRQVPAVSLQTVGGNETFAYGRFGTRDCMLNVFLDGTLIRWADEVGLDQIVNRQQILAIEVYPRAVSVPPHLSSYSSNAVSSGGLASPVSNGNAQGDSDSPCGALLIWTKPVDAR